MSTEPEKPDPSQLEAIKAESPRSRRRADDQQSNAARGAPVTATDAASQLHRESKATAHLLGQWQRGLHIQHIAHAREVTRSDFYRRWVGSAVVVLSTVVGTTFFTTIKHNYTNTSAQLLLGSLGVLAGALAAIQGFFNFGKLSQAHTTATAEFGDLRRKVEVLQTIPPDQIPIEQLDGILAEWKDAEQNAPPLSQRMFDRAAKRVADEERDN